MHAAALIVCAALCVCAARAVAAGAPPPPPSIPDDTVCALKASATDAQMEAALEWGCGAGGVDCTPIQPGGPHYTPEVRPRAAWLVNAYFRQHAESDASCQFGGIAELRCGARDLDAGVKGVNLGGWLVLEPWITPSLFAQFDHESPAGKAIDEYTFCRELGADEARRQLTAHWDSWFTEAHFKRFAELGLNLVRVPVGYWAFGDEPPFIGNIEYLDRAVGWAAAHGLRVLIDLHGGAGSQNGFDNSGRACGDHCVIDCPPEPMWARNASLIDGTVKTLARLAARYAHADNIYGIELLNEPRWDTNVTLLTHFYERAYAAVRDVVPPSWQVVASDSFRYNAWRHLLPGARAHFNLDAHVYQGFTEDDIRQPPDGHLRQACGYSAMVDWMHCMQKPTIVGEWSLATTDCAKWLLGFQRPPTAPSHGVPCGHNQTDAFYRAYAARQLATFARSAGWVFWTARTETQPEWSYLDAVERGWMPKNVAELPLYVKEACVGDADDDEAAAAAFAVEQRDAGAHPQ